MRLYEDFDNLKIRYFKNVLFNYYFLVDYIRDLQEQEVDLKHRIDDMCEVSGVAYDKVQSGKNDSPAVASMTRANDLSIQHATLEMKINDLENQLRHLKRDSNINERLKKLNKNEEQMIQFYFHKRMSDKEIGRIKKITPQYAHKLINSIIENMIADM